MQSSTKGCSVQSSTLNFTARANTSSPPLKIKTSVLIFWCSCVRLWPRRLQDVLVAGGTWVAFTASIAIMVVKMAQEGFISNVYFETCAMLITFIMFGKYLEAAAKGKTSAALHKLMDLQAKTALMVCQL